MSAAGFAMLAIAVLVAYEAFKHIQVVSASGSSAPSGPATSPNLGNTAGVQGGIPSSWLIGLAKNESPSALQGDFRYGTFGLSWGATPGIGTKGATYGSQDPNCFGCGFTPTVYSSWEQAVQGLSQWINQHAPSAWQYAQSGNCQGFFSALQSGGYGGNAGWPAQICGLAA